MATSTSNSYMPKGESSSLTRAPQIILEAGPRLGASAESAPSPSAPAPSGHVGLMCRTQTSNVVRVRRARSCRERTATWSCASGFIPISSAVSPRGLDPCIDFGCSLLERVRTGVLEGFDRWGSRKSSSQSAIAEREHHGLAELPSAIVSSGVEAPRTGEQGLWSVVIPTYNRLPILLKCLQALEEQRDYISSGIERFEVVVIDDGSTDGTVEFLSSGNTQSSITAREVNNLRDGAEVCSEEGSFYQATAEAERTTARSFIGVEHLKSGRIPRSGFDDQGDGVLSQSERFPHVKLVKQDHGGATKARNLGLKYAKGAVILFIDSDLIVADSYLKAHGEALRNAFLEDGDDRAFTHGRVVNTTNFQNPQLEKLKITDYSAAFFASSSVAISHHLLFEAGKPLGCNSDGPFDDNFSAYGWEDLEFGVRLKQCGARIKQAPAAVGYHWHPGFSVEQLPNFTEQRGVDRSSQ